MLTDKKYYLQEGLMNVYILFLTSKTMQEIVGIYSSSEKAENAKRIFPRLGSHGWDLWIVEREVNSDDN
jgi:hypothetical protein